MKLDLRGRHVASILKNKVGVDTPIIWDHKITFRCQALCGYCPFNARLAPWKGQGPELTTAEVTSLADGMYDLGCISASFEGGEPLLRDDLRDVLAYAKRVGFKVHLVTNGVLLRRKAAEIAPLCDVVTVSLDFPDERHDRVRGAHVFAHALEGIREALKHTCVTINVVITRDNVRDMRAFGELTERLGANGISFEPVENLDGLADPFRLEADGFGAAVRELKALKQEGAPILNTDRYLDVLLGAPWTCASPRLLIHTDPYGNVRLPCGNWGDKYGLESMPTRGRTVREVWHSPEAQASRDMAKGCTSCKMSCNVEPSLLFTDLAAVVFDAVRSYRLLRAPVSGR